MRSARVRVGAAPGWRGSRRLLLPLSRAGLVAVAVVAFFLSWNDYLFASALITNRSQYTAGLGSCFSGFNSTAADQLVTEAERTTNPAGLLPLYHQMNTLYSTDAPYAVMTDYVYTGAVQQEAAGYITITPGSFFYIAPLSK